MSANQILLDRLEEISKSRGYSLCTNSSGGGGVVLGKEQPLIGPYRVLRTIGKGSWGIVRTVKDTRYPSDPAVYAIKTFEEAFILRNPEQCRRVLNEIKVLQILDHPFVCKLIEVVPGANHRHIVMEYYPNGELYDHILKHGKPTIDEGFRYFYMLTQAVRYLNSLGIAHRDIKLENLIFDEYNHLRLCDFGFAVRALREGDREVAEVPYSCGSPHYAAPEVIQGKPVNPFVADIWSMGVVLHVLLTGAMPFMHEERSVLLEMVTRTDGGARDRTLLEGLPSAARDLVESMLTPDPQQRILLQGVIEHPWYRQRVNRLPLEMRTLAEGTGLKLL